LVTYFGLFGADINPKRAFLSGTRLREANSATKRAVASVEPLTTTVK
jgi:hypothetical protein